MSKIIGVTVGTPLSVDKIKEKLKPVTSVDGVKADENGDVKVQRTHWKEVEHSVELFEKTDLTGETYYHPERIGLETGVVYEAIYNGNFYDVTPVPYTSGEVDDKAGLILVKKDDIVRNQYNTGLPFAFVEYDAATAAATGNGAFARPMDGSATAYLFITGDRTIWHKLDKGYLPDNLGTVKKVNGRLPDEFGRVNVDVGVKTVNGHTPDANGNVKIEFDGSLVQADYAESDPTAPGYIQNRTHWREVIGVEGEVIPEKRVIISGSSSLLSATDSYTLLEGVGYTVTWNGQAYTCTGKLYDGAVYLGNLKFAVESAEESEHPFCIRNSEGKCTVYDGLSSGLRSVTVKVEGNPEIVYHKLGKNYLPDDLGGVKTVNGNAPDENGNVEIDASVTAANIKSALGYTPANETAVTGKLDKVTVDIRKEIAFGSTGKLMIGKFKVYDTQVTVDITATTGKTYNGKLVIATQNYYVRGATVYGDADNAIAPNIYIKPCSPDDQYIEVYFAPQSWSKNVIHIYGNSIKTTSNICTSVTAVPETATIKPVNALTSNFAAIGSTGGGGVTDYNDLENTPCKAEMVEILPETTFEIDPEMGGALLNDVYDVQVGSPYTVKWNGTEYNCTAQYLISPETGEKLGSALGNVAIVDGTGDTGDPFCIAFIAEDFVEEIGAAAFLYAFDGSTSVTLSVQGTIVTQPLSPMFLPRLVVTFTRVNNESENNAVADKSFEEVMAAVNAGYEIVWELTYSEEISDSTTNYYTLRSDDIAIVNSVNDGVSTPVFMFNMVSYGSVCSITYAPSDGSGNTATVMFKDF